MTIASPGVNKPTSLAYRKDIDGLRGIAVLLVIAFHFNIPPISGGYIGVDIFFVVSGFLITSLLCLEDEVISPLGYFYARRIKRLQPVFMVIILLVTAVSAILLLPDDFLDYLRSLYFSFIFQANDYFDGRIKDYFAANAQQLPLLHIWSLSIEWQFYLIFPLLFLFAKKYLSSRLLAAGMAALLVLLTIYSWHQTGNSQQAYFYTSARFFELLAGCLAALIKFDLPLPYRQISVYTALLLLLVVAAQFDGKTAFPGLNALQVCLLTMIVVLCGHGNPLLENSGLVYVGKISYSAYLWHWPFVAFFNYLQTPITGLLGVALFALVIFAAHLSYVWIEKPGRQINLRLWKLALIFVLLPALTIAGVHKISRDHDGFFSRLGGESDYIYNKIKPYLYNDGMQCSRSKLTNSEKCLFGDESSPTAAYLIGDSHAGHYRRFTEVLALQAHLRVISLVHGECLMLPGASNNFRSADHASQCANAIQIDYERIKRDRPKYVLIAQRWAGYSLSEVAKLGDAIAWLLSQKITPVVLGPVAEDGRDQKSCFYQHIKLRQKYFGDCAIIQENDFEQKAKENVAKLLAEVRRKYPQVVVIDVQSVQCDGIRCAVEIDGVPIYDDAHHINGYGSRTLAQRYVARFGNPLNW